ncbi:hypothetical protein OH76DRAFT_934620 [Lentinus brumalis]|uniref:Uncharacterized protein n=1 Tax=Lentinus brumalis TaxID=2498619 RepID=A0A371CZB7_9APHY|nr:hypothetical protein OH76DRAFT_934620 [Polyporus brumalis]
MFVRAGPRVLPMPVTHSLIALARRGLTRLSPGDLSIGVLMSPNPSTDDRTSSFPVQAVRSKPELPRAVSPRRQTHIWPFARHPQRSTETVKRRKEDKTCDITPHSRAWTPPRKHCPKLARCTVGPGRFLMTPSRARNTGARRPTSTHVHKAESPVRTTARRWLSPQSPTTSTAR